MKYGAGYAYGGPRYCTRMSLCSTSGGRCVQPRGPWPAAAHPASSINHHAVRFMNLDSAVHTCMEVGANLDMLMHLDQCTILRTHANKEVDADAQRTPMCAVVSPWFASFMCTVCLSELLHSTLHIFEFIGCIFEFRGVEFRGPPGRLLPIICQGLVPPLTFSELFRRAAHPALQGRLKLLPLHTRTNLVDERGRPVRRGTQTRVMPRLQSLVRVRAVSLILACEWTIPRYRKDCRQ
eukprot:7378391-Prymnesium_polylepis.1